MILTGLAGVDQITLGQSEKGKGTLTLVRSPASSYLSVRTRYPSILLANITLSPSISASSTCPSSAGL